MKTTLYTVLCVAIRLGAVFMAVGLLEQAPTIFVFFSQQNEHFALGTLLFWIAGLLIAFALWLWPNILAWWAIGWNRHEILESPIGADQVQRIAFSVMGAWLLISGVSGCVSQVVRMLIITHDSASSSASVSLSSNEWHWLVQCAATAVGGAALAIGSRGLVGVLHRLRGYPHNAMAETDPDAGTAQGS
jgi:hypothetical protein